jgi:Dolichyl-phosphate-mannose-protein mannosyltransferase
MAAGQETEVERGTGALAPAAPTRGRWPLPVRRRLGWMLAVPPAVTLAVMLWGMAAPSYWRDESATLAATGRSIPQLLRMLGRVDAVHGFYYLLLWPVVHFAGTREFETRLPSAIAMAAAALGIAVIGRRLRSRRAGLYAGLVFAAMPLVTYQGHDARPYALETAIAVLATYLLLRAAENPAAARFAAYALSLVLLGSMHLFGLLIIPAHAFALIPAARLSRARRGGETAGTGSGAAATGSGAAGTGSGAAGTGSGAAATGSGAAATGSGPRAPAAGRGHRQRPGRGCRRAVGPLAGRRRRRGRAAGAAVLARLAGEMGHRLAAPADRSRSVGAGGFPRGGHAGLGPGFRRAHRGRDRPPWS